MKRYEITPSIERLFKAMNDDDVEKMGVFFTDGLVAD